MKENSINKGYIFLWCLVLILAVFIGISFFHYKIGQGRWECVEYKIVCSYCKEEGTKNLTIDDQEFEIKWTTNNSNFKCYCTEYKRICVKEVWTRYK